MLHRCNRLRQPPESAAGRSGFALSRPTQGNLNNPGGDVYKRQAYEDWKPPGKAKKPKSRQKSPEEQFQEAKNHCFRILADYLHLLRAWRKDYVPHSPEEAVDVYKRQELDDCELDRLEAAMEVADETGSVKDIINLIDNPEKDVYKRQR